jgi:DNA-binding NarL/FixJ family response regulator
MTPTSIQSVAQLVPDQPVAVPPASRQKPSVGTSATEDKVELSPEARAVVLLQQEGQSVSEIANDLNDSTETIDSYLGIKAGPTAQFAGP